MNIYNHSLAWYLSALYIITVLIMLTVLILEKRSPLRTISWILVIVLIPVLGVLLYIFFGQEYRKQKMFSRKGLKGLEQLRELTKKQLNGISRLPAASYPYIAKHQHLVSLLLSNSNAIVTADNEVQILNNGVEKFPLLFDRLRQAKKHIHIEYYIIANDKLGNEFREILVQKAQEGVEVRLIFDDVGSWSLKKKYLNSLRDAGVQLYCFMRIRFPHLSSRANYRNHRKIVVIDSEEAFVGGINIADRYLHGTKTLGEWRDTHAYIKGGAATMLQVQFMADWFFVSKEMLSIPKYFKELPTSTNGDAIQILSGGPDSDWETINQFYFSAITSARKHIYIATPYLIPTDEVANALKIAALSQIDVRILLSERNDGIIPKWSTYSYIDELLEAGVKVYFYQPGFVHSKLIMVDGDFCSIGTANFDFRSLETNFEVNAAIYNQETTAQLEAKFLEDLEKSKLLTKASWESRPRSYHLKEALARIFSPML